MYARADYGVKWWGICASCKGGPSEGRCPLRRCAHCLRQVCKPCDAAFDDYPGDLVRCCIADTIWDVYPPFCWEKDYTPGAVLLETSETMAGRRPVLNPPPPIARSAPSVAQDNKSDATESPASPLVLPVSEDVGDGEGSQLLQTT